MWTNFQTSAFGKKTKFFHSCKTIFNFHASIRVALLYVQSCVWHWPWCVFLTVQGQAPAACELDWTIASIASVKLQHTWWIMQFFTVHCLANMSQKKSKCLLLTSSFENAPSPPVFLLYWHANDCAKKRIRNSTNKLWSSYLHTWICHCSL